MRRFFFFISSLFFVLLGRFTSTFAADDEVASERLRSSSSASTRSDNIDAARELEEEEAFWSRRLASMSTSMSYNYPEDDDESFMSQGGSCGNSCRKDGDCWHGGVVICGKCGKYEGAEYYHLCYDPSTPAPTPFNYFPEGGSCGDSCESNADCQYGGYNPCEECGKYVGTLMYQRCYMPNPNF